MRLSKKLKIITDFANSLSDKEYQLRCMWAIQILESKLTMINLELQENLQREVVVRLTHRIKSAESIFLKLRRKGYTINLDNAERRERERRRRDAAPGGRDIPRGRGRHHPRQSHLDAHGAETVS